MRAVERGGATPGRGRRRAVGLAIALAIGASGAPAGAHWLRPEQVIAQLRAPELREAFSIVEVARSPELPRLLVVRVDRQWSEVDPARRVEAAEEWRRLWRESTAQGVLAIVDSEGGATLVSFDAHGRALLHDRAPSSPLEPPHE